jgi:hypothetical protein
VLKKASHKKDAVPVKDVPADNPEGTLARLAAGLRRVLKSPVKRKTGAKHRLATKRLV